MRHSEKKAWKAPTITQFADADADEVWEYYKAKGSPEELARLRKVLEVMRSRMPEAKAKRRRGA